MNKPTVVGISSVMGGGKSSLAIALGDRLFNATVVHFDNFDGTTEHPPDWRKWFADGADYNAWNASGLVEHLERLIMGETTNADGKPFSYVVFDAPLGRANRQLGVFIDHMVHLDTPLDIAMARRILRDGWSEETKAQLRAYLDWARQLYLNDTVGKTADLILDGASPVGFLADQVIQRFQLRIKD